MGKFKGTTGEVEIKGNKLYVKDTFDRVATVSKINSYDKLTFKPKIDIEMEANVQLIADAFTVRQKIDWDLPELLEQRNEMWSFINSFISDFEGDYVMPNGEIVDNPTNLLVVNYESAKSLINKYTK